MTRTAQALKTLVARLAAESGGNVAVIFALALPAMVFLTLGGVDIHRASTVRMNLQDALDAASLAAARSQYTDDENITRVGMAALQANLAPFEDITLVTGATTFHLDLTTGAVVADATVNVRTLVANIVLPPYGQLLGDELPVSAHSEALRSNKRIEVALVIDNTGSMAGAKLANTKAAAIALIDRLEAADGRSIEEDAIKISLVPFSQTVRVAQGGSGTVPDYMSNAATHTGGGAWNDDTNPYSLFDEAVGRFDLFEDLNTTWGGCIEARPQPYDIRDTPPSSSDQKTMFVPYFAPDEPDRGDFPDDSTWQNWQYEGNDYVDDGRPGSRGYWNNSAYRNAEWFARLRHVDKYETQRRRTLDTGFGPNKGCDLQPLIRLTSDYAALRAAVNNMVATGNTNVPLGTIWGWHTLSPNAPFRDGRAYTADRLQKIIIIMTDGENVMSDTNSPSNGAYSGLGYIWQDRLGRTSGSAGQRSAAMDNRFDHPTAGTEDLCGNMKDNRIEVYTVAVQVNSTAQTLLRRCASDSDHYFPVNSASGIGAAFDRIAGAIENLRISR